MLVSVAATTPGNVYSLCNNGRKKCCGDVLCGCLSNQAEPYGRRGLARYKSKPEGFERGLEAQSMRRRGQPCRRRVRYEGVLDAAVQRRGQGLAGPCGANRVEEALPLSEGLQAALGGWLQGYGKLDDRIQLRPIPSRCRFPGACG